SRCVLFCVTDLASSASSTLSLHDALPISSPLGPGGSLAFTVLLTEDGRLWELLNPQAVMPGAGVDRDVLRALLVADPAMGAMLTDRKSTRLNSSHVKISYAVFCLKKKKST